MQRLISAAISAHSSFDMGVSRSGAICNRCTIQTYQLLKESIQVVWLLMASNVASNASPSTPNGYDGLPPPILQGHLSGTGERCQSARCLMIFPDFLRMASR